MSEYRFESEDGKVRLITPSNSDGNYYVECSHGISDESARRMLGELQAILKTKSKPAYRPKKLVWENFAGGMACDSMIGFYRIWFGDGKWVIMLPRSGWCKAYLSLEEAKEACQAHYDALWKQGGEAVE